MKNNIKSEIKLVIKGAYYYDRANDRVVMPIFTSTSFMVDAIDYVKIEEFETNKQGEKLYFDKDDYITYEGKKYYLIDIDGASPSYINSTWELLSNIDHLEHQEDDFEFFERKY